MLQIDIFMGLVKAGYIKEGSRLDVANRTPVFQNETFVTWLQ